MTVGAARRACRWIACHERTASRDRFAQSAIYDPMRDRMVVFAETEPNGPTQRRLRAVVAGATHGRRARPSLTPGGR